MVKIPHTGVTDSLAVSLLFDTFLHFWALYKTNCIVGNFYNFSSPFCNFFFFLIMCYESHVTCLVSRVTCHMSHVPFHWSLTPTAIHLPLLTPPGLVTLNHITRLCQTNKSPIPSRLPLSRPPNKQTEIHPVPGICTPQAWEQNRAV